MDLPPPPEPTTVEVQKMNQKQDLIQKIKSLCEATKDPKESIPVNLPMRPYFLDVCNATNADEIFSYKAAHFLLDGCRDGLEVRNLDYGDYNPEFLKYHINTDEIFKLKDLIIANGKGTEGIYYMPAKDCASDTFRAIYTIINLLQKSPFIE